MGSLWIGNGCSWCFVRWVEGVRNSVTLNIKLNLLKIIELVFISNFALICFPMTKLAKKTGTLLMIVVLTGCLLVSLRVGVEDL